MQWGIHSTPLLDGDRLYLQLFHAGGHLVVALDKADGKEVWKVQRKSDGRAENEQSYASPVMWRNGKDAYLIVHGDDYAMAHRLTTAREIWRVGGLNPKDQYRGDLRFVASAGSHARPDRRPSAKNQVRSSASSRTLRAWSIRAASSSSGGCREARRTCRRRWSTTGWFTFAARTAD